VRCFVVLAAIVLSNTAEAQVTDWPGVRQSPVADAVMVAATPPIFTDADEFRMMFKLTSSGDREVPYAALRSRGGDISGWLAFSNMGSKCETTSSKLSNITKELYGGSTIGGRPKPTYDLDKNDGSGATAGINRPAIVVADFRCDRPVARGDEVTVQIELWLRVEGGWKEANYVFERKVME